MQRLSDIFLGADRIVGDLLRIRGRRLWAIPIRKGIAQKHGLIRLCGLLGAIGSVQINGASDPLSPCLEKIDASRAYQLWQEGASLDLVAVYGEDFSPLSEKKNRTGCTFQYRGLVLCYACRSMGPGFSGGASLEKRLRARRRHRSLLE